MGAFAIAKTLLAAGITTLTNTTMKHTKQKILAALKSGKPVTLSRLTELTGSTKVSTRISDLRREGHNIVNRISYKQGAFLKSTYTLLP
jgi:hypothetical protein